MTVEPRSNAVAIRAENSRSWPPAVLQNSGLVLGRIGAWAGDTAQQFGALVSALMAPAVACAYAFAAWSLAGNLGWTDSFVVNAGPFSNWLVWLALAILVNAAASILRRHTAREE
jgi:hypothetical protein